MALASLGGYPLPVDPESVAWTFRMKTAEVETLGGKVVQVYGTDLGDMAVAGSFGVDGWTARDRFTARVNTWIQRDAASLNPVPLRFVMPSKGWDFQVHIKAYTANGGQFEHSNENFNPRWALVLFIVEDATRRLVKSIQDLYIARLMAGIGWKQTDYNGPPQEAVDSLLAPYGGEVGTYLGMGISGQITDKPEPGGVSGSANAAESTLGVQG